MINAKKSLFAATKVAENRLALGVAFMSIQELEKEVSRRRHNGSVLSKRLNGKREEKKSQEKEEVVVREEVAAGVVAVGASPIESGVYKVVAEERVVEEVAVAEEIVAGIEVMSVGSGDDEDGVVDGKIVVRLPGDRKRRIVEDISKNNTRRLVRLVRLAHLAHITSIENQEATTSSAHSGRTWRNTLSS